MRAEITLLHSLLDSELKVLPERRMLRLHFPLWKIAGQQEQFSINRRVAFAVRLHFIYWQIPRAWQNRNKERLGNLMCDSLFVGKYEEPIVTGSEAALGLEQIRENDLG